MTQIKLLALASALLIAASGCEKNDVDSPSEVYERYFQLVAEGRTFEEDAAFYTAARLEEATSRSIEAATAAGKTLEEYQAFYLEFTQDIAKCSELTLRNDSINADAAILVYDVKDICNGGGVSKLKVTMKNEKGWKIVTDELQL